MKKVFTIILMSISTVTFAQEEEVVEEEVFELTHTAEPEFPGGVSAMMKFIATNVQYPMAAMEKSEQGTVYVQLYIEKDGSVTEAKIVRGVSETIDKEALRVVNKMPKWKPGESEGKPVRVKQVLPIRFTLN